MFRRSDHPTNQTESVTRKLGMEMMQLQHVDWTDPEDHRMKLWPLGKYEAL